jgi:tetratricopeptide (TPR) repeat protein
VATNREKLLDSAQKHIRKGAWDKALQDYQQLVAEDPSDLRNQLKLAELYEKCNRNREALDAYRSVAYKYLKDEFYERAIGVFKLAMRLDPEGAELHRDIGDAYHRLGRLKDAVRSFHYAQKLFKDRGDEAAQRQILERMVQLDPEDVGLRIQLGERYAKDGMIPAAVELLMQAAERLEEEGRLDEYIQVAERVLYLDSDRPELRIKLARIHSERQDYKRALKHLQQNFKEDPRDIETLRLLSFAFERIDKPDKACLVYRELARVYQEQGQQAQAKMAWQQVLRLAPGDEEAMDALGQRQAQQPARPNLEDSGSLPGLRDTNSLSGAALKQSTQPAAEVEFLDDDLGEVLQSARPAAPVAPARPQFEQPAMRPAAQRPAQPQVVAAQPVPVRAQAPAAPQARNFDDIQNFAADALEELGDIAFEKLDVYPAQPVAQAPASRVQPAQVAQSQVIMPQRGPVATPGAGLPAAQPAKSAANERAQLLIETKVFIRYGLYDKAFQALHQIVAEEPDNPQAWEMLRDLYASRGMTEQAIVGTLELARIYSGTQRSLEQLDHARKLGATAERIDAYAREHHIGAVAELPLVELDVVPEVDVADAALPDVELLDDVMAMPSDAIELDDVDLEEDDELPTGSLKPAPGAFDELEELSEGDLALDTDAVDELESMDDIHSGGMAALPDATDASRPTLGALIGQGLTEHEADRMFDELFSEPSLSGLSFGSTAGNKSLGSSGGSSAELAEVDMLIKRGLTREAEDSLRELARQRPSDSAVQFRLQQLALSKSNPFGGERSLSQRFRHASIDEMMQASLQGVSASSLPSPPDVVDTNYELATAYLDMGLLTEAQDEFTQALENPAVSLYAMLGLAMCEHRLGYSPAARERLRSLLSRQDLPQELRKAAYELFQRIN